MSDVVGPYGPLQPNNQKGLSFESILGDIWDTGKSVFKQVSSLKLDLYTAEKLAELRGLEEDGKLEKTKEQAGMGSWGNPYNYSQTNDNSQLYTIAGIGLVGIAAILIARGV